MTEKVLQGTDVTMRTFKIKDSGGVVIPLSAINDYHIYVYTLENNQKTNVLTFKKTPTESTDKQIVALDTETIGFIVPRSYTKIAPEGLLYAEIEVQITADSNYESSLKNSGGDGYVVCEIIQSSNPTELI